MNGRTLVLELDRPGERLDKALAGQLADLSRSRIQRLIGDGLVVVNSEVITRPGCRLAGGERITVHVPPPSSSEPLPEDIPLDILFEDANLIVLNKPAGMVVHPAAGHRSGTLVNALLAHAPEIKTVRASTSARTDTPDARPADHSDQSDHLDQSDYLARPGIVHRLDKDTSGLIVVAKNEATLEALQRQFRERTVEKVYLALVDGAPPTPTGLIEAPIGRNPKQRKRMAVVPPRLGRESVTEYHTLESFAARSGSAHTLLEARPRTGRTHQIRVHLAYIGCPVAGDTVYGRRKTTVPGLKRHFLHAARLTFQPPDKPDRRTFEAPLPEELQQVLDELHHT